MFLQTFFPQTAILLHTLSAIWTAHLHCAFCASVPSVHAGYLLLWFGVLAISSYACSLKYLNISCDAKNSDHPCGTNEGA